MKPRTRQPVVVPPKTGLTFKEIVDTLKNLKELIIIVAALVGGIAWIVSYFATREQLEKHECYTKVNVRMLQATAGVNYGRQQIKQTQSEARDQKHIVEDIRAARGKHGATDAMVKSAENRLDELVQTERTLTANMDAEQKTSQKALAALTQNACLDTDKRRTIMDQLASGQF